MQTVKQRPAGHVRPPTTRAIIAAFVTGYRPGRGPGLIDGIAMAAITRRGQLLPESCFSGRTFEAREAGFYDLGLGSGFGGLPLPQNRGSDGDLFEAFATTFAAQIADRPGAKVVSNNPRAVMEFIAFWTEHQHPGVVLAFNGEIFSLEEQLRRNGYRGALTEFVAPLVVAQREANPASDCLQLAARATAFAVRHALLYRPPS